MASFQLKITLGNAAMTSRQDIASALRAAADRVESGYDDTANIRDENGNIVGVWSLPRRKLGNRIGGSAHVSLFMGKRPGRG